MRSNDSLRFSVSQYTTWPLTFEQDLELFARAGVNCIEVCEAKLDPTDPNPQLQRLKDSGLTVTSVQPRLHSLFPDVPRPEPASPRARMERLKSSIALFSRHFPGTTLVTITGAAPRADYASAYRIAAEEYREAARVAADHGVRIALEPLNPILMNADTFICSLAHAGRVIEAVDHPSFGLFVDVWHIWEDATAPAPAQLHARADATMGDAAHPRRAPDRRRRRALPAARLSLESARLDEDQQPDGRRRLASR